MAALLGTQAGCAWYQWSMRRFEIAMQLTQLTFRLFILIMLQCIVHVTHGVALGIHVAVGLKVIWLRVEKG